MLRKTPASPARAPLRASPAYWTRRTAIPTDAAASGISPTARRWKPKRVR